MFFSSFPDPAFINVLPVVEPVMSSCNIPTIPLIVAQAMNPAPRPPSPTARAATQKALRRENTGQLSSRDARVLMGFSESDGKDAERTPLDSFFSNPGNEVSDGVPPTPQRASAPPRPSREMRRSASTKVASVWFFPQDRLRVILICIYTDEHYRR